MDRQPRRRCAAAPRPGSRSCPPRAGTARTAASRRVPDCSGRGRAFRSRALRPRRRLWLLLAGHPRRWSERYDRELDDMFAIQDDIATNIASKLQITLVGSVDAPLVKPATQDME